MSFSNIYNSSLEFDSTITFLNCISLVSLFSISNIINSDIYSINFTQPIVFEGNLLTSTDPTDCSFLNQEGF